MPPRSNPFQREALAVERALHPDAVVEESATVFEPRDGPAREVDVLVTVRSGARTLLRAAEATSRKAPADLEWVDQMIGKYIELDVGTKVLYSESGFTPSARSKARSQGFELVSPGSDQAGQFDHGELVAATPKMFKIHVQKCLVTVRREDGFVLVVTPPIESGLFDHGELGSGQAQRSLVAVVQAHCERVQVYRCLGLHERAGSATEPLVVEFTPTTPTLPPSSPWTYLRGDRMESSEWQQVLKIVALCSITIGIPDTPVSRRAYGEVIVTATEIPLGGDRYHSVATDHRGALRLMTHKLSARPSPKASDRTKKKKRREK